MQKRMIRNRIIIAIMCMILFLFLQMPVWADTQEMVIVQDANAEYIIYHEKTEKQSFEFAYSNEQNATDESLDFITSITDKQGNYVAYIDQDLKNKYAIPGKDIYFYAKVNGDYQVKGEKLDLTNAIAQEHIMQVEKVTKTISVDTNQVNTQTQTIDGAEYTVTTGKVMITDKEEANYFYQLIKLPNSDEYNRMMQLAETIETFPEDTAISKKVTTLEEFYQIYSNLVPNSKDSNWIAVENKQILQPVESQDGEQYILWLKKEQKGQTPVIDAQFLTCKEHSERKTQTEQVEKKIVSKLPITYDSLVLVGILGVIVVAILVVLILKKRSEKTDGKHGK